MKDVKTISMALLDGLSPLDALFAPTLRPGSDINLIASRDYPGLDAMVLKDAGTLSTDRVDAARRRLAARLHAFASSLESPLPGYHETKPIESTHG